MGNILTFRKCLIEDQLMNSEAVVKRGPFKGLKLATDGAWNDGDILAKIIGSYEKELYLYVEKIAENKPSALLNIGASDGFYALGMKQLIPEAAVFAFDIDVASRDVLEAYSETNDLPVGILTDFSFENMEGFGTYDSLAFIVDCEGCEIGIVSIPQEILVRSTFLVELHEKLVPGITKQLLNFLSQTHDVTLIEEAPRDTHDFPEISQMSAIERLILVCEFREGPMNWLYAQPMRPQ